MCNDVTSSAFAGSVCVFFFCNRDCGEGWGWVLVLKVEFWEVLVMMGGGEGEGGG